MTLESVVCHLVCVDCKTIVFQFCQQNGIIGEGRSWGKSYEYIQFQKPLAARNYVLPFHPFIDVRSLLTFSINKVNLETISELESLGY